MVGLLVFGKDNVPSRDAGLLTVMEALELRLLPLGMGWVFRRASIQEHDGDPIIPIAPVLKAKYDYSVIARWEYDNPNCFVLKVFPKKSRPTEVMEAHVL